MRLGELCLGRPSVRGLQEAWGAGTTSLRGGVDRQGALGGGGESINDALTPFALQAVET